MTVLKTLIRATFVLPFTAGQTKHGSNGIISHDGSTSGVVLLLCIIVMLTELLIAGSSPEAEQLISIDILSTVCTVWACIAILSCIAVILYYSMRKDCVNRNENWNVCSWIKLRFLWLFTLASVVYNIMQITEDVDCLQRIGSKYFLGLIICQVSLSIFGIVQTGFLTYFSQFVFVSNLGLLYALLVIFMANISIFVASFALTYRNVHDYTRNNTMSSINLSITDRCEHVSPVYPVVEKVLPYLEPTVCENALLSILFLVEMWPKKHLFQSYDQIKDFDCSEQNEAVDETRGLLHDVPDAYSTIAKSTTFSVSVTPDTTTRTAKFVYIAISVLLNIPSVIMYCLRIAQNHSVDSAILIYGCAEVTVVFFICVSCFYALQCQCRPSTKIYEFDGNDKMLITSYMGALAYYTVRLISNIFLMHYAKMSVEMTYLYCVTMIGTYFQTVFLLQAKNYEKIRTTFSFFSIEYISILLATENLITWCIDTFIASQYIFVTDAAFIFYGKDTWIHFYSFLFPFVIFYRFKCFVAYYGLYHKYKA